MDIQEFGDFGHALPSFVYALGWATSV